MNVFELSFSASIALGGLVGANVSRPEFVPTVSNIGLGAVVALLIYAIALTPGLLSMRFAPGRGATNSRLASLGGSLLLAGAFVAPFLVAAFGSIVIRAVGGVLWA